MNKEFLSCHLRLSDLITAHNTLKYNEDYLNDITKKLEKLIQKEAKQYANFCKLLELPLFVPVVDTDDRSTERWFSLELEQNNDEWIWEYFDWKLEDETEAKFKELGIK